MAGAARGGSRRCSPRSPLSLGVGGPGLDRGALAAVVGGPKLVGLCPMTARHQSRHHLVKEMLIGKQMECRQESHLGLHWSRGSSGSVRCGRSADEEPPGSSQGDGGAAVEDGGGSRDGGPQRQLGGGEGAGVVGGEVDAQPTEGEGNQGQAGAWQLKHGMSQIWKRFLCYLHMHFAFFEALLIFTQPSLLKLTHQV